MFRFHHHPIQLDLIQLVYIDRFVCCYSEKCNFIFLPIMMFDVGGLGPAVQQVIISCALARLRAFAKRKTKNMNEKTSKFRSKDGFCTLQISSVKICYDFNELLCHFICIYIFLIASLYFFLAFRQWKFNQLNQFDFEFIILQVL